MSSMDTTDPAPADLTQVVDVTLQLRLPANHPVAVDDLLFAQVTIGGHAFTLERQQPLRPTGERLFLADYTDDTDYGAHTEAHTT